MDKVRILGARAGRLLPHLLPDINACRRQGVRVLMLVPEQYTLQAERELMAGLKLPGLMDVDVLSPRRLTTRIRESGGRGPLTPLDDRGMSMAIAQSLIQCQEELVYYRRVAATPGLPDRIGALLADLGRAGVSPDELAAHAQELRSGTLRAKETDLARIWRGCLELIDGRFIDTVQQQRDLVRRLRPSGVMKDAALFVYGFDVLPRPTCELLAEAAGELHSLTVAFTMDAREAPDGRIFLSQRQSALELTGVMQERGIAAEWRYLPDVDAPALRDPALAHMEKWLFTRQAVPFAGDASAVRVHAAANPFAEALFAAHTLRRWHDEGIAWGRMAVALADPALAGVMAVTCRDAGIPCYAARKDSALRHGLCRYLTGALRCATAGCTSQYVMQMAKSGFSPLMEGEARRLENYAIENGIDRGKWLRPFTRGEDAAAMEEMRQRLMAPVETLRGALREAKSAERSVEAVYALLEGVGAYQKLMARESLLLERGLADEAARNRQIWQVLMDLLDQLYALLGEKRAVMKDLTRLIEAGLNGAAISSLPPQPDVVMIGEAGHLMTGSIDALFLAGMQDGVMGTGMTSLITEAERRQLADAMHRPIGMTRQETAALRQSDFYRTMALPARYIQITYAQSAQDGGALRPAGIVEDLRGLFPSMVVTGGVLADDAEAPPASPQMALDGLATRLRAMQDGLLDELDAPWLNALRWLWRHPAWHERIRAVVENALDASSSTQLRPDQTRRLFAQDEVSISRLEKFAACPYQHYVDYGLKPVRRQGFTFEATDAGDFYHAALQGFAHAAMEREDWPDLPEEEVDRIVEEVVSPLTALWADGPLGDSPAMRLQAKKYVRTVKRAAWLFTKHAASTRFVTVGEEIVFGEEGGLPPVVLTLHDGRQIALRGKIDRIDRWEGDKGLYLRVVDYKSSKRDIDPTRLWYGLQLQLLLYLQAAAAGMGGKAAGAFYFTVQDPLVEASDAAGEAERAIAKALHLRGVVLSDPEVIQAMDSQRGYTLGSILSTKGEPLASAPAYTEEELQALIDHTRETAETLADAMRGGDVSVTPAQVKDWTACAWCDYAPVCGFDPMDRNCTKRVLPVMSRQELLGLLANKKGEGHAPAEE